MAFTRKPKTTKKSHKLCDWLWKWEAILLGQIEQLHELLLRAVSKVYVYV